MKQFMRVFSFNDEYTYNRRSLSISSASDEDVSMHLTAAEHYLFHSTEYKELPRDIIFLIFYNMSRSELLCTVRLVCKEWYALAMNENLWYHHTFNTNSLYYGKTANPSCQLYPHHFKINSSNLVKLNYRNYFIEQILMNKFSTTTSEIQVPYQQGQSRSNSVCTPSADTPVAGSASTPTASSLHNSFISMISGASSSPSQPKRTNGIYFFKDSALEEHLYENKKYVRPTQTYRHSLVTVPSKVDPNVSDRVYSIGGLHNTLNVQPDEVAEDYVHCIEMTDSSLPTPSTPSTSATPSSPTPMSPLAMGFKKLFTFGKDKSKIEKISGFKRVRVVGKPAHVGKHTSVLFESDQGSKIILFGGVINNNVSNDLYTFDIENNVWTKDEYAKNELVPSPRTNHSAIAIDKEMWIIGGGIGQNMTPTDEVWVYNTETHTWRQVKNIANMSVFTPRLGCAVTEINKKILIYGGGYWLQKSASDRYWRDKYTDLFILDTQSLVINRIDMSHNVIKPEVGTFPASHLISTQWYIIGGAFENKISYDIYCLDTVTMKWRKLDDKFYGGDSLAACHFITSEKQNKLLIFGGYCYNPLDKISVFSLRYKDMLDTKGFIALEKL